LNGEWQTETILHSSEPRYNGLVELQLHPKTEQPYIAFWESHESEAGTVRILAREAPRNPGDANLDGVFDSSDLTLVFKAAKYEAAGAVTATWEEGDWTGDGRFTSADLIAAFNTGDYRRTLVAIPEPSPSTTVLTLWLLQYFSKRISVARRKNK
jgi:hypothetical protein